MRYSRQVLVEGEKRVKGGCVEMVLEDIEQVGAGR